MDAPHELIVDSFAGGGGASLGIEQALGRSPDIAINHDAEALAMHAANHPDAIHLPHNVWKVDPVAATGGKPVGLLWASPDCKHHSKAKGGKPVKREIRDLAWVVVRWARQVRPRIIMLENVEEFRDWGPLDIDGRPCKERKGKTFDAWVGELRRLGYRVEWRELRACDFGAPTIRKRLFLIARRDGRKIVWPAPTHGKPGSPGVLSGKLLPWRAAAEIIDWSIPCPSIFLTREEGRAIGVNRPLAENTMARIAKGVKRYVLEAAEPFIVTYGQQGGSSRPGSAPMHTITASSKDTNAIAVPFLVPRYGERQPQFECQACGEVFADRYATGVGSLAPAECPACGEEHRIVERPGQEPRTRAIAEPAPTIVPTANGGALAAVYMAQHNEGNVGRGAEAPLSTIFHRGTQQSVVAAFLAQHNTGLIGHDAAEPVSTIIGKGCTQAVVSAGLVNMKGSHRGGQPIEAPTPTVCASTVHAAEVRAFLVKYFGTDQDPRLDQPLHTVTTKDRFGLVMVRGELYQIADIGMRMLTPRELFRAQGFPDDYEIETGRTPSGSIKLTKTAQTRMCGNSVCPPMARALVAANFTPATSRPKPSEDPLPLFVAAE